MKLLASLVLVYYFMYNLVVSAYEPIAALFSRKNLMSSRATPQQQRKGFYKTLSGLLSNGKLSVLTHKHAEELRMITNDSQEKESPSWWPFVANKPKVESKSELSSTALDDIPEERMRSDSTTLLTNLVKQSLELNRNEGRRKQIATYESTNLAGFMEYDPKVAAMQAYKRTGRGNMNWFRT